MKCECGAKLERKIVENYDVSDLLGIGLVVGKMPVLKCPNGHADTMIGGVLNDLMLAAAATLVRIPERLPGIAIRYLRKMLGLSQDEMAARLGCTRESISYWECGQREIGPQYDLGLRTIVIASMSSGSEAERFERAVHEALSSLNAVRSGPPSTEARIDPVMVQRYLDDARTAAAEK